MANSRPEKNILKNEKIWGLLSVSNLGGNRGGSLEATVSSLQMTPACGRMTMEAGEGTY
jgi:hypothetical protein